MSVTTEKTVGELAREIPASTRVFEKLGIDYCCGGGQTLERACAAANVPLEEAIEKLRSVERTASAPADRDWQREPLGDLIGHIKRTHHRFVLDETARIAPLAAKVCGVHGANHPELRKLEQVFQALSAELHNHLMKEETVLFPYIERMEQAVREKAPVAPPPFGSVRNPVSMMMHEHDDAGGALRELRAISNGYTAPPDGCISYQTLYKALADFEADLHQHIHLENNILFPRAIEMERGK